MSLIPHTFFPRSMFDFETWMPSQIYPHFNNNNMLPFQSPSMLMPSMLDLFDPFDEMDRMLSRNLQWVDQPMGFTSPVKSQLQPAEPHRHRISIDCAGYRPESIKTELKDVNGQKQLCVCGLEERFGATDDNYSRKEFKSNYLLPRNAQAEKLVSFMAPNGHFIVDVPLSPQYDTSNNLMSFLPKVIDMPGGHQGKGVQLQLQIPENVDPNKIQVSVKDRDLIVKMNVKDKEKTPDMVSRSRVHFYNRTRLPEATDFSQLKCSHEGNQLNIYAPLRALDEGSYALGGSRKVPVEESTNTASIMDTK